QWALSSRRSSAAASTFHNPTDPTERTASIREFRVSVIYRSCGRPASGRHHARRCRVERPLQELLRQRPRIDDAMVVKKDGAVAHGVVKMASGVAARGFIGAC